MEFRRVLFRTKRIWNRGHVPSSAQESLRPPPRPRALCHGRAKGGERTAQRQCRNRGTAPRGARPARRDGEAADAAKARAATQGEPVMLHIFLDERPWFRAKRHGYGAGLPIAWQGWVMLAAQDRKSTRLHSRNYCASRMPSTACK